MLITTLQSSIREGKYFSFYPSELLAEFACNKNQINRQKQTEVY